MYKKKTDKVVELVGAGSVNNGATPSGYSIVKPIMTYLQITKNFQYRSYLCMYIADPSKTRGCSPNPFIIIYLSWSLTE